LDKLSDIVVQRIKQIISIEHRPVSCLDFLPTFQVEGKEYRIAYGTLRNILSRLRRTTQIQIDYKTKQTFYTLPGIIFGRSKQMMTSYHTGVHTSVGHDSIYKLIQNLPLGKKALHDIHLRLEIKGIWSILSRSPTFKIDAISKDIRLPRWHIKDLALRVTVHRTNTISVIVGGSYHPVAIDFNGIIRLSNALTIVEERLSKLIQECNGLSGKQDSPLVPDHLGWIVTMWHFGIDGLIEYTGEKFSCTWEVGQNALIRAYTKDFENGKTRIRLERQEYPRRNLADAIEEKLNSSTNRRL